MHSCREGTKRMLEILTRITEGQGREGDIELLEELAGNIKETALCGLGQTAPNPVLSTLKYFRDEYEAHIKENAARQEYAKNLPTIRLRINAKAADSAHASASSGHQRPAAQPARY